ncbi:hypothetical protein MVEN_00559500 [Mycena venus]|uniref:Ankyrin n=1 Tax=Mycena venus TaxID=2733690 RepID=A0A8H6YQK7_9AGAR|nr:hypothetical protein MVEN_00559500 [Mycena venus]
MPVPLWTNKAEARYNVTTECTYSVNRRACKSHSVLFLVPSLGLHSAAATGNVGLVEYALARGQPINSVLDGVLPLHAAAAGGNEGVVKLLIERGADVNAPRLPRRYSNDKNRDTSAPIVGTSGSTPLHFAAANGHTAVVQTLLLRGAHPNRADKHGITPEMLARQNGWDECADVLKTWILNKDRDLRERQGPTDPNEATSSRDRGDSVGEGESSTRKRIHMKRSMDTALSMLKGSSEALKPPLPSAGLPSASTSNLHANTSTPPPSPGFRPFGEYTFYSNSPSPSPIDPGSRRPSLPQITYPAPPPINRKSSLAAGGKLTRRPRSAGTGAEREADAEIPSFGRGGAGSKRLGSKYSLLGMFKKGQAEATASGVPLERTDSQPNASSAFIPSVPAASSSNVALPSVESSPASVSLGETPSPYARRPQPNMSPSPQTSQSPAMQKSPTRPPIPLAVDLHNALAQHQQRDRSGSGASAPFDPGLFMAPAINEAVSGSPASISSMSRLGPFRPTHVRDRSGSRGSSAGNRSGSVFDDDFVVTGDVVGKSGRPGILRAHNRSISNGPAPPAAVRALRFDPASGGSSRRGDDSPGRSGSSLGLRGSTSAGSLSRLRNNASGTEARELPDSAPAAVQDFDLEALEMTFMEDEDEDEYAYGRPLPNSRLGIIAQAARQGIPLPGARPRGLSLTSSSQSSLSPALSTVESADPTLTLRTDFPFSINEPPPIIPVDTKSPLSPRTLFPSDNRGRGDSVSSTSTTESQINPQMSTSGTTSGSGSVTVTTPLQAQEVLAVSPQGSPLPLQAQLDANDSGGISIAAKVLPNSGGNRLNERRTHTPLDINLSLISSHAQAEALVQKELQDILEMPVVSPDAKTANYVPLSARLAAYGESLELERKFRSEGMSPVSPIEETPTEARPQPKATTSARSNPSSRSRHRQNGVDRQNSVDIKPTRRRVKEPRRPHTSSGTDSPSTESIPTHHSSRSTSAVSSQTDLRTDRTVPIVAQTAATAAEVVQANNRVRRARTPDPEIGLSRVSSLDGIESIDVELGPVLTRVSTAPMAPSPRDKSRDLAKQKWPARIS